VKWVLSPIAEPNGARQIGEGEGCPGQARVRFAQVLDPPPNISCDSAPGEGQKQDFAPGGTPVSMSLATVNQVRVLARAGAGDHQMGSSRGLRRRAARGFSARRRVLMRKRSRQLSLRAERSPTTLSATREDLTHVPKIWPHDLPMGAAIPSAEKVMAEISR